MTKQKQIDHLQEANIATTEAIHCLEEEGDAGQVVSLLCMAMAHISRVLVGVTDTGS